VSIFTPIDPRGPDQRRKQLIAKLAGQAQAFQNARVPRPAPLRGLPSALLGEGKQLGSGASRPGGQAHVTQSPNILASVLSRLGVVGRSHAEEMSGGRGLPIAPPAPHAGSPIPTGSAIPTPGQQPGPPAGLPTGADLAQQFPNTPGVSSLDPNAQYLNMGNDVPSAQSNYVDLGNGQFYDPATGHILGTDNTVNVSAVRGPN
jgi:hypothetical protein